MRITKLSPTQFENLIFDLSLTRGMKNVVWRTPGADGGRDIEGIVYERDFSGAQTERRWFVECKRYSASVDWPTIYQKIAYADVHKADVLLMCTTSTFSPNAVTHVAQWNAKRRDLTIRLWPVHDIEAQLSQHPDLALKYGLANTRQAPGKSFLDLALSLSKAVSSHYSKQIFAGLSVDPMLLAAQSFADLLLRRMEDLERAGRIQPSTSQTNLTSTDAYIVTGSGLQMDDQGLRAFFCYLFALTKTQLNVRAIAPSTCEIKSTTRVREIMERYRATFDAIAIWSDFEYRHSKHLITITQRS